MLTKPADTGQVLSAKTRARVAPDLGKIVTRRRVAMMNGGTILVRVSLPAISMHIAALEAEGQDVRRVK